MKKRTLFRKIQWAVLSTLASVMVVAIACSSESEDQLPTPPGNDVCEGSTASLANDIMPILQQNCAISGCHVSGTGRVNFTVKDNVLQYASQIRANTQSGFMPPSSSGQSLSESEKSLINCWVVNGANDN